VALMKDYRIQVTVKNALLLSAIENAGYKSCHHFADMMGISYYGSLMPYVNLTRSPIKKWAYERLRVGFVRFFGRISIRLMVRQSTYPVKN
jgi:hypothetical protein